MIVSVWFVPTAFVAVAGVILMFASTHVLLALPVPPAVVFSAVPVVRVIDWPLTLTVVVAWTTVVPVVAEVITTVQVGARGGVGARSRPPTKSSRGSLTIDAVAV